MGLGLGALGFLLVLGVRGGHVEGDASPPITTSATVTVPDAATAADAAPVLDASPAPPVDAAPLAPPPPPPPPLFRVASLGSDPTVKLLDGAVGHRPFLTALAAAGVTKGEAYRVLRAVGKLHNLDHCSPEDTFHVAKDKATGHVVAFEYVASPVDVWQARDESGTLEATKLNLHVELRHVATPVVVGDDLRASLTKAGFEEPVLQRLDDALDGHAELTDIHAGARLRLLATEERLEGVFLRYASLDAVEYTPATPNAVPLRVYHFPPLDPDKLPATSTLHAGSFYDAKGQEPFHGGWRIPVPTARIASRFNPHRMHPTLHVVMPHNGVDFAAPTGTPIYAAASGTVKTAGDSGPCGNMVQIEHTGGIISSYCHMSRFASGIHVGEHVETRQLVGYVGQTGRATGPHCHFAIKRNGIFIDPLAMKLDGVRVVPPAQRDAFDQLKSELDKQLDAVALPAGVTSDAGNMPAPDGGPDSGVDDTEFDDPPIP
jgi:murein DD-endopeptidase MepM/ murein hydrolase activator NlpD